MNAVVWQRRSVGLWPLSWEDEGGNNVLGGCN